ncbi:DeoR/GlpR family DNA-binding transcription regulator [Caproiciproducens sp.]
MNAAARRLEIMQSLQQDVSMDNTQLAQKLNVSVMTIRRDLSLLQEQGILTVSHGGAILNNSMAMEPGYTMKQNHMIEEKRRIGVAAAQLVNEGEAVFIDCGNTAREVALALLRMKREATVFTNSVPAMNVLAQAASSHIKMVSMPGVFRPKSMGFIGPQTMDFIEHYHLDVAFIGVEGIDAEFGASTPDVADAMTKQAVARSANRVVVLADHTKVAKRTLSTIWPASDVHTLVTGKSIEPAHQDSFVRLGVKVVCV